MPVRYEMLYCGEWRQNLLLADSYGAGVVFLAGDSVHLVIPTGGLGMNTGVGDAFDLSWKLAATLQGWGARTSCDPTRSSGARSASAMSVRHATPRRVGANGGRNGARKCARRPPPGQAARDNLARVCRCRAAQDERDDRCRTRLSLRRLADHRQCARAAPSICFAITCRRHGPAPACRTLARRRHADPGSSAQ